VDALEEADLDQAQEEEEEDLALALQANQEEASSTEARVQVVPQPESLTATKDLQAVVPVEEAHQEATISESAQAVDLAAGNLTNHQARQAATKDTTTMVTTSQPADTTTIQPTTGTTSIPSTKSHLTTAAMARRPVDMTSTVTGAAHTAPVESHTVPPADTTSTTRDTERAMATETRSVLTARATAMAEVTDTETKSVPMVRATARVTDTETKSVLTVEVTARATDTEESAHTATASMAVSMATREARRARSATRPSEKLPSTRGRHVSTAALDAIAEAASVVMVITDLKATLIKNLSTQFKYNNFLNDIY